MTVPPVQPVPSVQPVKLAYARRPFVLLRKAIAGPRRETEREGGGLSAERTLIKNSPSILYHQKIKIAFNFIEKSF